MTPERHRQVKELFLTACELPIEQRSGFLRDRCGQDADLRANVEALLNRHTESAGEDLDRAGRNFPPGTAIGGRFRIVAWLGCGGMGEVYRADDLTLGHSVALKFLPAKVAKEASWLARLRAEVRIAREISHPNVCRVHDIHEADDEHFISMEWIDGQDLDALQKRIGGFTQDKALQIAHQLCAGLAAIHARGILHRDLKPANVMLDRSGCVRIMDLGLAALREQIERRQVAAGTPAYMAPEQRAGRDVSARSDIYALGLLLTEVFTGRSATASASPSGNSERAEMPYCTDPEVMQILTRCLSDDPEDRPASALAVAASLPGGDVLTAALAANQIPSPEVLPAGPAGWRWSTRQALGITGVGLAMLVLLATVLSRAHPLVAHGMRRPPAVMAEKARELLAAIGWPEEAAFEAYGFIELPFTERALALGRENAILRVFNSGPGLCFWYRRSASPLAASEPLHLVFGNARVTPIDPWPLGEREVLVVLDSYGRLLAVEAQLDDSPSSPGTAGWNYATLAAWTGLDFPLPAPQEYGSWSHLLERAGRNGRPARAELRAGKHELSFAMIEQDPAVTARAHDALRRKSLSYWEHFVLILGLLTASLPLAWRNRRLGWVDARGAQRVAIAAFGLRLAASLLQATYSGSALQASHVLILSAAGALALAAAVWLFYLALEPLVRRFWPHALVTWSRVLNGRWNDPAVGQHLLVGAALGVFWTACVRLSWLIPQWMGIASRDALRPEGFLAVTISLREVGAGVFVAILDAAYYAVALLLLIALLRALTGRLFVAGAAAALMFTLLLIPRGSHPLVAGALIGFALVGVATWGMLRFGLLLPVTGLFVMLLLNQAPLTLDRAAWYSEPAALLLVVVLALGATGLWAACRPRGRAAVGG